MKKKSQIKDFTNFIASYHCLLESNFIQYNQFFLYLIHLLSEFQIFGIIVLNLNNQPQSFPFMNIGFIINAFSYISRPYEFFAYNQEFFYYCYLIPLTILTLYIFHQIILFYTFKKQNSKSLTEFILRSNNAQLLLHWIFIVFFSVFDMLISLPFLQLTGISIVRNIRNSTFGVVEFTNSTFGIITIIIIILIYTLHFVIIKETITLQLFNFKVLILTGVDYIINLLVLILVFIEVFFQTNMTKNYLLVLLYSFIQILKINSLLKKFQYNQSIQQFLIRISISFLFISLVFLSTQQINDLRMIIATYILVTSLAMVIINQIKQNNDFSKLINIEDQQKTQTIQYLITIFASKQKLTQVENICFFQFLSIHRQHCDDKLCCCQKGHFYENEQKLKQLFLKQLILNFGKSINKIQDQGEKGYFSLFYIQGLIAINQSVKAYQQANILLLRQTVHQIAEQKNLFSEQTTYSMTIDENQIVQKKKSNSELIHKLEKISIQQLNYINQLKISIILEIAKQNLIQSFSFGNVMQKNQLSQSVQLFMKVEEQHQQLKANILNILNKKKDVFLVMQSTTKINPERFLNQCLDLIQRINNMEIELNHLFQEFPSKKMQSIFSFYCAEILNNFLQAYRIINYNAISDNALIKIQKNYTVDLLTTQLHYMIMVMDHQGTGLQIVESSQQMYKLLLYEQQEFKGIKTILSLLPKGFQTIHKHLIEDFLIYGKSKFFREQNINFILGKDQFLIACDFFFDFDLTKLQELTFQVFFTEINCTNSYILLNNKNSIIGVTKEFCKQLKLQEYECDQIPDFLFHTDIQQLFPEYFSLIDINKIEVNQSFGSVQFIFVDLSSINSKSFQSYIDQKKKSIENLKQFIATIAVQIKRTHTVIEIKNLIETKKSICLQDDEIDNMVIEEFGINDEFHIPQPKQFNYDLFPKMNIENNQEDYYIQNEIQDNADQLETNRILALQQRQLISESMQQYDLISPGRSHRQLIDRSACPSNQMNFSYQQKFFQKYVEEKEKDKDQSQDCESEQIKISAKNQGLNYQNAEIRENLKLLLNDENQTSLYAKKIDLDNAAASSTLGTFSQNFQLYKKYELLQQIVTSQKFSVMFDVMIFTLLMVALVSVIFAILLINNSNTDIYSSLSQMQMLEFYFAYISPCYTFLASYASLKNYQNGEFSDLQLKNIDDLIQFNQYHINQSYSNMRSSFTDLSNGEILQNEISEKVIPFQKIKQNEIVQLEISLREGIFQTLQYQYMFQFYFTDQQIDSEQIISYILNIDQFDELIFNINTEIITFINDNHILLQHKWLVMCVRCIYLVLLFQLSAWLLYIKHIRKFSKILKLFLKIDVVWVSRDLERCKELINILNKDSDLMFRYKFNIFLKEKFFKNELLKKHVILEKINQAGVIKLDQKQKLLLKRTPSFLLFSSLFFVFFLYAFIINYQAINFMDYYLRKSQSYNSIGQLGLSIEKMYSLREIIYFKSEKVEGYDYINYNVTEKYFNNIQANLDIVSSFLQTYTQNDGNFYDNSLLILNNQSLCETQILIEQLNSQQLFLCNQIYDGVLSRGLSITLTKIRDIIITEMNTSMEFQVRYNTPFNEIEISIYINLLIMQVLTEIKQELQGLADQLNLTIQVISIIYLIFAFFKSLIVLLFIRNTYINQFQNIKKITILLPQAALFIDDLFERQIRQIIAKEHLV